jgi:hypothetical protein
MRDALRELAEAEKWRASVRDVSSCRTLSHVRVAIAALLLSGCAASEYRVQRPDPCVCAVPCRRSTFDVALPTRTVHGVALYESLVVRLENRWGTPLESTFPPPVLSPADDVAIEAWVDGVQSSVTTALRDELDRERPRHVEPVEHARLVWLDALEGKSLLPPVEAKLMLDQAIQAALDDEASFLRDRGAKLIAAKLEAFTYPQTIALDAERITEGSLVEPMVVRDVSRARLAEPIKKMREAYAVVRATIVADRLIEQEAPRWAWARKKP